MIQAQAAKHANADTIQSHSNGLAAAATTTTGSLKERESKKKRKKNRPCAPAVAIIEKRCKLLRVGRGVLIARLDRLRDTHTPAVAVK